MITADLVALFVAGVAGVLDTRFGWVVIIVWSLLRLIGVIH